MPTRESERQLADFIAKFTPEMGRFIRATRAKMRAFIPQALELVYDNYNFFVIGYGPNEKAGDAIFSLRPKRKVLVFAFSKVQSCRIHTSYYSGRGNLRPPRNNDDGAAWQQAAVT